MFILIWILIILYKITDIVAFLEDFNSVHLALCALSLAPIFSQQTNYFLFVCLSVLISNIKGLILGGFVYLFISTF